jgi:putative acetyltransferase
LAEPGEVEVGAERPDEAAAIAALHRAAFGDTYEAAVVDGLRAGGWAFASLVARVDGAVAGHVMFSDIALSVDGRALRTAALAPLAVEAGRRAQGIGGRLVRAGLAICRERAVEAVVVLGDPAYYRRFGFTVQALAHVRSPYGPGRLLGLELAPGALAGGTGEVRYPPPFSRAQG